jgi:NCS1 family nucleobase:cation symporter-1
MSGLAIFLAPIAALLCTDYWLVKSRNYDAPALYRRRDRYWYTYGINWRAAAAFLVAVVPNTPGLAKSVNPNVVINEHIQHIYDMNYLYGFCSAAIVYYVLNRALPAHETLLEAPIYEDIIIQDGVEIVNDGVQLSNELKPEKYGAMASTTNLPSP